MELIRKYSVSNKHCWFLGFVLYVLWTNMIFTVVTRSGSAVSYLYTFNQFIYAAVCCALKNKGQQTREYALQTHNLL